jgi:hypothetical protein
MRRSRTTTTISRTPQVLEPQVRGTSNCEILRPDEERYVTLDVIAAFLYYMFKFIIEINTFSLSIGQVTVAIPMASSAFCVGNTSLDLLSTLE